MVTQSAIEAIENWANALTQGKSIDACKRALVKGIPPGAVLKPSHATYRLQNQAFVLGDRVTMVSDSGSVPLCARGVVIGVNPTTVDVVWDTAFMSGTTLGDRWVACRFRTRPRRGAQRPLIARCSPYRGSTVPLNSCLNLTRKQFMMSTTTTSNEKPPPPSQPNVSFRANPRPGQPPPPQHSVGPLRLKYVFAPVPQLSPLP